jgi:hypothetical protein
MQSFVEATRAAVAAKNWYAALALALTMPDICGRLEAPGAGSQARYVAWYDRHLLRRYQRPVGSNHTLHTFLCAADCYALRCAYLHQGEFGIEDQRAQQALTNFHFTLPRPGMLIHNNQINNALQLQVDVFCEDVCVGVEEWRRGVFGNADIQARLAKLATIG